MSDTTNFKSQFDGSWLSSDFCLELETIQKVEEDFFDFSEVTEILNLITQSQEGEKEILEILSNSDNKKVFSKLSVPAFPKRKVLSMCGRVIENNSSKNSTNNSSEDASDNSSR